MNTFPPPFPPAVDEATEPGLGLIALKAENARLRADRDQWRAAALATKPARSRVGRVSLAVGKWGTLLTVLPALGAALAKRWPDYADLIQALIASVVAQ